MPLIYAMENAHRMPGTVARASKKRLRQRKARTIVSLVHESGALDRARNLAHDFDRRAKACIHGSQTRIRSRPFTLQTSSGARELARDIALLRPPDDLQRWKEEVLFIPSLPAASRPARILSSSSICTRRAPLAGGMMPHGVSNPVAR